MMHTLMPLLFPFAGVKIVSVAERAVASPAGAIIKELNPTFTVPQRPFMYVDVKTSTLHRVYFQESCCRKLVTRNRDEELMPP